MRWSTGRWQDYTSTLSWTSTGEPDEVDAVRAAVESSPGTVQLQLTDQEVDGYRSGIQWPGLLLGLALVGTLALLVGGRDPWRGTRWAWFWMFCLLPATLLAYLLLEPLPLHRRTSEAPRRGRLTGGWALLLALVIAATGHALLPVFDGLLWNPPDG